MTASHSVKARFALLTTGRLILGCASLFRAVETYRPSIESSFPFTSLGFLALGLVLFWWAVRGMVALFGSTSQEADSLIANSMADVDSQAPSGLKPLWIGLGLVISVFVLWILLSKLFGAA